MNHNPAPFTAQANCLRCWTPVRIHADPGASAVSAVLTWMTAGLSLCPACHNAHSRNPHNDSSRKDTSNGTD